MPTITCENEKCQLEFNCELKSLHCENEGPYDDYSTQYNYTGTVSCPHCQTSHEVVFNTIENNETGDIWFI